MAALFGFLFFFSSRRRHTRCLSDWSSDVCSSDLRRGDGPAHGRRRTRQFMTEAASSASGGERGIGVVVGATGTIGQAVIRRLRSEEHTSELQSLRHLVCRLLLEKKKIIVKRNKNT